MRIDPSVMQPGYPTGGVVPIGQVASFTQPQRSALQDMVTGPAHLGYMKGAQQSYQKALAQAPDATPIFRQGDQFYNQASDFLGGALGNINAGTERLTDARFNEYLGRYMNPYRQQVVDSTTNAIQRAADIQRSRLNASATAAGAFGNDRDAIERGLLNEATLRQVGDTTGNLMYQGFNEAARNALGQYGTETQNALTGAGIGIQGGSVAGNLGGQRYREGFGALQNMQNMAELGFRGNENNWNNFANAVNARFGAGSVIQSQNQRMLDAIRGQQTAPLNFLSSGLQPFQGGSIGAQGGRPNSLSTAANIFDAVGGFVDAGGIDQLSKLFGGG